MGCLVALILPLASSNAPARTTELAAEDGKSDAALEAEQSKEEERLVEAAKRRYESLKHRAGAIKLAASSEEDHVKAELLTAKAKFQKREDALKSAQKKVDSAKKKVDTIKDTAKKLSKSSDKDENKADENKDSVMTLQSKAETYKERAQEEENKIEVVQKAAAKEQDSLPSLLDEAQDSERKAYALKREARDKMGDSRRKTDEAARLDRVAEEKEREAHLIRERLIKVLEGKTKMLQATEKDEKKSQALAKKGAAAEAAKAKQEAAKAAAEAKIAHKALLSARGQYEDERKADALVEQYENALKRQMHVVAEAKRRYEEAKMGGQQESGSVEEERRRAEEDHRVEHLKTEAVRMHHKVLEAKRAANLMRSARETDRRRERPREEEEEREPALHHRVHLSKLGVKDYDAGRDTRPEPAGGEQAAAAAPKDSWRDTRWDQPTSTEKVVQETEAHDKKVLDRIDGGSDGRGNRVGEDEDGHLVVRARAEGGPLQNRQKEDGHYSTREENFKQALANAYKSGYEHEDDNLVRPSRAEGERREGERDRKSVV